MSSPAFLLTSSQLSNTFLFIVLILRDEDWERQVEQGQTPIRRDRKPLSPSYCHILYVWIALTPCCKTGMYLKRKPGDSFFLLSTNIYGMTLGRNCKISVRKSSSYPPKHNTMITISRASQTELPSLGPCCQYLPHGDQTITLISSIIYYIYLLISYTS